MLDQNLASPSLYLPGLSISSSSLSRADLVLFCDKSVHA